MQEIEQEESRGSDREEKRNPRCEFCSGFEQKIDSSQPTPEDESVMRHFAERERMAIIHSIAQLLNEAEGDHGLAENIFEEMRYRIAEYVLKHEFNAENSLSVQLTLWLEQCRSPDSYEPLQFVIDTYLKDRS